jgi:hypothetical protein
MNRWLTASTCLLLAWSPVMAQEEAPTRESPEAQAPQQSQEMTMSGMSVVGNQEAPKALVIVPWKSSRMGDGIGLNNSLNDGSRPVDKDVFLRELGYYTIRTNGGE